MLVLLVAMAFSGLRIYRAASVDKDGYSKMAEAIQWVWVPVTVSLAADLVMFSYLFLGNTGNVSLVFTGLFACSLVSLI